MTAATHPGAGSDPRDPPQDLRAVGERIDVLLDASSSGGAVARERAEELVRLVADLYGAGLERILDLLHASGHLDDAVLEALADDDLVASLLIVHGLHPYGVEERVERALESVRPYLGSHGGDVELLAVTWEGTGEGTVRLRLLGSCDGCPSSSVTLKLAVEGAIEAAAPEISTIAVETASQATGPAAAGPLISVESLMSHLHEPETAGSWHGVPELAALQPGGVVGALVDGTETVGCRAGEDLYAFRDSCPRCGSSLARASLARRLGGDRHDALLVCPGCRAHFDVRRAGACSEDPGIHLEPLPLLRDGAVVSVAVPGPVHS